MTVKPAAGRQYTDARGGRIPAPDEVRPGTWSVPIPMPESRIPYSLAYLLEDAADRVHVVDPGMASDDGWHSLVDGLSRAGHSLDTVASITCTHLHPDHTGQAERLARETGAPIAMHSAEIAGMQALRTERTGILGAISDTWGVPADRRAELESVRQVGGPAPWIDVSCDLDDGDRLEIPGRAIDVVWTPGHTGGHICLRDAESQLLITGDHVLPIINPGLGLGGPTTTNPLADYLSSLTAVARWENYEVCPGHGFRFTGLALRCAELAAHQTRRAREVEAALAGDTSTVWDVASQLTWTGGWENLQGFRLASALAQTAMLAEYVREV